MIAIVGATGVVGRKIFEGLIDNGITNLILFASKNSNGKILEYKGKKYIIYTLNQENVEIAKPKFAIFSAGSNISKPWAKTFTKLGCIVIDNSSAYRKYKNIPLVAYGTNNEDINLNKGIIASPNCSTLGLIPLLDSLKKYGLERVIVTTMQSVSGAGKKGLDHLSKGTPFFDHPIQDNIIAKIGDVDNKCFCEEENKLINESRKILHMQDLNITANVSRVPVSYCHSEYVNITFKKQVSKQKIIDVLKNDNRIILEDLPMPINVCGDTKVHIGRIKKDSSQKNSFSFFIVSDNLLRGAATNTIEILKEIINEWYLQMGWQFSSHRQKSPKRRKFYQGK